MVSSMEEIQSDLLQLSGTKKNHLHLRKAFNLLKTHASSVANFTLQWHDLVDHFVFINNSIQTKLDELHQVSCSKDTQLFESQVISHENNFIPTLKSNPKIPEIDLTPTIESLAKSEKPHLPSEVEINEFPIEEGKQLVVYLIENSILRKSLRFKINDALKASKNPGKLVIESVRWFYSKEVSDGSMNYDLNVIRRSCVLLLEGMVNLKPLIEPQEKQEAKELLLLWMAKIKVGVEDSLLFLNILWLAGAFGLKGCFDGVDILNLFYCIVQRRNAVELFRSIGLEYRAAELVEKLISEKKRIVALKFIYAFKLVAQFSPVTILRDHLMEAKISFRMGTNSQQAKKEMSALREVIQCIETYKLGSVYSPDSLRTRLWQLENQTKKRKADAIIPSGNKQDAPDTESKLGKQKKRKAKSTSVSMEGAPSSFVNQASADLLIPPPHHQSGLYSSQGTPYFPSPSNSMFPSTSQYTFRPQSLNIGLSSTSGQYQSANSQC